MRKGKAWTVIAEGGFVRRVQGYACSACGHIDAPEQFSDIGTHLECPEPTHVVCGWCDEEWAVEFTEPRKVVGTSSGRICHDCLHDLEQAEEQAREAENPMTIHDEFRSSERWN